MGASPVRDDELPALFAPFAAEDGVLIAVSGGPDSLALLILARQWRTLTGWPGQLVAATVDHGLRREAAAEARQVASICARIDVPHAALAWEGHKPVTALQATAREARYALLDAEAARCSCGAIATAHTLDDQAETVLMRIAHGSGIDGVAAMRTIAYHRQPRLIRPFLAIPKARLVATLAARGETFITDPSNRDTRFERVRWREIAPVLAQAGLSAERLALLARRAGDASDALHAIAARFPIETVDGGRSLRLAREPWLAQPVALRRIILASAVRRLASGDSAMRLERLEALEAALAHEDGKNAVRRTLCGILVEVHGPEIRLRQEPARRRGRPE